MKTEQAQVLGESVGMGRPALPVSRKVRPVVWWAALGALSVGMDIYLWTRWLSDLPPRIPSGPTKVPGYMWWNIKAQEILFPLAALVLLYLWVIRPLLRRQKLPWDGLALMALFSLMWQNYGMGYSQWASSYNSVLFNRGSWYGNVPGWMSPNAQKGFAEAPIWNFGFYVLWILIIVWLCFLMRLAKRRWPNLGNLGLFGVILAFSIMFDFLFEAVWVSGGLYNYAGAIQGPFTMFSGHYYQMPIYEGIYFGGVLAVQSSMRFFKNDKGESICERGIEEVRVGSRAKTGIRLLAMCGMFAVPLAVYNVAWIPFALHADTWPADIQKRSYFTQGMCGGRTDRACPGEGVPVNRPGSPYLTPDGKITNLPENWKPPVPFAK